MKLQRPTLVLARPPILLAAGLAVLLSVSAEAQTSKPAAGHSVDAHARDNSVERQAIRRSDQSIEKGGTATPQAPTTTSGLDVRRVAIALGIVVGLIILLRVLARRLFPGVAATRAGQVIRVLSRSVISPRQQVLLVQIGRRVIVVGDTGTQLSPLCEITDSDEIAELIVQLDSQKRTPTRTFAPFLTREREQFDVTESAAPATAEDTSVQRDRPPVGLGLAEVQGELSGLVDRVRSLARQYRKT